MNIFAKKDKANSLSLPGIASNPPPPIVDQSTQKFVYLPVEKIMDSDAKLRLKFLPLEPVEHVVDIIDNDVSIEGFPMKLNVYPNREVFVKSENINGLALGNTAKFRVYLNGQKDSLNIKITSKNNNNFRARKFYLLNVKFADGGFKYFNHIVYHTSLYFFEF